MASKRKRVSPRIIEGDPSDDTRGITPERERQSGGHSEFGRDGRGNHTNVRTMRDAPFERMLARKSITERQYAAGIKYRHHWYRAGLAGSLQSIDPNRIFASDATNFSWMAKTESEAFHRERYREAVHEIGVMGSIFVEHVICKEFSLEDGGYLLGWDNRPQAVAAATERMRAALDDLAGLWGI